MIEKVRLGDVCIINPKVPKFDDDFEISFVPMTKIGENGEFDPSEIKTYKEVKKGFTYFQNGDVLFAKITPCMENGKGAVASGLKNEIGFGSTEFHVLRPLLEKVKSEWLFYLLWCPFFRKNAEKNMTGSAGQKRVPKSFLENYFVAVTSLEEQQKEINVLDKVTDLIDKRKKQLSKLDELVKARFVELFGDPKLNDKGWKSGVLADYFDVKGGKRIPKGMGYSDIKTNHPYLRATDMKNETILEDDIHYISEEVFQHIKRYTVNGGDIYLTNVGVNLGMAGVIPQKFDGASLTENAVKLVPKTERIIDGLFLAHYINSPGIQDYINERKMAVGVPKLAIFRIETMPLLIPPMEVQQDFIAFVKQTDKSKLEVQKSLEKLELLKKALMQKYFG